MRETLYDTEAVAKALGCSPRTLEGHRVRGEGPTFVKVGRLVRYPESAVAEYLERQRRTSTSDNGVAAAG